MYFYHASALGVAGEITRPIPQTIPSQAATSLAVTGGVASATVENFKVENILSFRRATAQVAGSFDNEHRAYTTMAVSTVEGLNVLDVVTADKIVARLSAVHSPKDAESGILAIGSYFENLRIAGQPVQVELADELLDHYSTFASFDVASKESRKSISHHLVGSALHQVAPGEHPSLARLERMFKKQSGSLQSGDFYWATLVDKVKEARSGLRNYGSIIVVPNFGIIHLAELLIQKGQRRLNMMRLELGSPVAGNIVAGYASCNGLAGDPMVDD